MSLTPDILDLAESSDLHFLLLDQTAITDQGISFLEELSRLRHLGVWKTQVTTTRLDSLAKLRSGLFISR